MSTLPLGASYVCILGRPIIHSVDEAIFTLRYFAECMRCGFCNDQCCIHGVDVDADNAERILALGDDFRSRIGTPASEWFTRKARADAEFPSGEYVRTRTKDGKCVFANRAGRGCLIHSYCLEMGVDYHTLKPIVSTLFPLTFEHGVLTASTEAADGTLICSAHGPSLYDGARRELLHYFGAKFVAELDALRATLLSKAA